MSKTVVVLDPGHGGYDPGAVYHGLQEKELNLKLALLVAERLSGVKVLLTRERDQFVSLADRVAFSNLAGADLFVSLHANAGGGRGFESFVYRGLKEGAEAVGMQRSLHQKIMEALSPWQIVDRGMKRAAFYVLRFNERPAVLIESLFIDNEREAALWRDRRLVEALAGGVVRGIEEALGVLPLEATPGDRSPGPMRGYHTGAPGAERQGEDETGQVLYTVQVGAFAYLENARQRLAEAQEAGFEDAYIYRKAVE